MTVRIVVDSAAALPADLVRTYDIDVVPMNVIIDGVSRPDSEMSTEELLAHLEAGTVSTSGPSPGEWAQALERASASADEVIALTVSAEMSSTNRAAGLAALQAAKNIRVIDTRSAAGGEGLVVVAAAKQAARGDSADDIEATITEVIDQVHLIATLDSLDHLVKSGRVPNLAGMAAHRLHVNPLFEFRQGAARALHPAIGHQAARHRIVHSCLASKPRDADHPVLHVAALDAAAPDRARALLDDVLAEEPDADWFVGSFGPVMLVHVGPGVAGLAWWWQR